MTMADTIYLSLMIWVTLELLIGLTLVIAYGGRRYPAVRAGTLLLFSLGLMTFSFTLSMAIKILTSIS